LKETNDTGGARVDLHLHSRASGTATNVWVQGIGDGVRESYTPPEEAYRMAKRAGMDFVTLTDHETIEGALSLAHHEDFFVGEEVSARVPEEGTCVDVLVYGLGAAVHAEAQARRHDVHELVAFLREAGVVHALAHPTYDLGGRLGRAHMERRLVLFGLWEFVNGSRPSEQNLLAREIAEGVGLADLRQMALRHGLPSPPHREVRGTAGSDDHGGAYVGTTYTVAPGVRTASEFLGALAAGEVRAAGEDGSVGRVAQAAFRLAGAAVEECEGGQAAKILRRLSPPDGVLRRLRATVPAGPENRLLRYLPLLSRSDEVGTRSALTTAYEGRLARAFEDSGSGFPALDFLSSIGGFMEGHLFVAPYLAVHATTAGSGRRPAGSGASSGSAPNRGTGGSRSSWTGSTTSTASPPCTAISGRSTAGGRRTGSSAAAWPGSRASSPCGRSRTCASRSTKA
jgi:hypothetical protein